MDSKQPFLLLYFNKVARLVLTDVWNHQSCWRNTTVSHLNKTVSFHAELALKTDSFVVKLKELPGASTVFFDAVGEVYNGQIIPFVPL